MSRNLTPIDISSLPDLLRLAEEVRVTNKPRELRREEKTVAILVPPTSKAKPKKHRAKTFPQKSTLFIRDYNILLRLDTHNLGSLSPRFLYRLLSCS